MMIPVMQTILHNPDAGEHGNCLVAVLASLLEMPIEQIPHYHDSDWQVKYNEWLKQFGLGFLMFHASGKDQIQYTLRYSGLIEYWCEISGPTNRFNGEVSHAVVGRNGAVVHDPHPSKSGLTEIKYIGLFIAIDPSLYSRHTNRIFNLEMEVARLRKILEENNIEDNPF